MIIIKFKGLILNILVIIILSSCCNDKPKISYHYGFQSRLVSSFIPMNCNENNIAIYDEYDALRLSEKDYELKGFSEEVGNSEIVFSININQNYLKEIYFLEKPRISICENGKLYKGLPILERISSFPPECHFCYRYDSLNNLKINKQGRLYLGSVKFISQKKYSELMTSGK